MMNEIPRDVKDLRNLYQYEGQEIQVNGWIYNVRSSGKIVFIQLRDGTDYVQCIVEAKQVNTDVFDRAQKLSQESSVRVYGMVSAHPKHKDVFEIQVKNIEIIQDVSDYPISPKEHGTDFLLSQRHVWIRSKKQWAIARVRNTIVKATYDFFEQEGFIKVDCPILTPTSCEDTTELFELDYFDQGKAYLSQSGQLYLEAAIFAHKKVFDFGPVFRAEKSKTRRHLTEFWMMDAEMAFYDQQMNMQVQEDLIFYIVSQVLNKNRKELEILERDISKLERIQKPFLRMTHEEAVKKLQDLGSMIGEHDDLGASDETILTQDIDRPLFIENYPSHVKAFYMKTDPNNAARVLCADLLAPEGYGEIIGGSQREDNYDILYSKMMEKNLPIEAFQWYLDLRKYGTVAHSGFGYGLERLTTWICGISHIRESIAFPRTIYRIYP